MSSETSTKNLHVTIITPARAVFDADASAVVAPAFDGELGVLPGHAAMLALLGNGELRVTMPQGQTRRLAIRGGFLQVNANKITVLTPESVAAEELKPELLQAEASKLEAEKPQKLEDREALDGRKNWLKIRHKVLAAKA